MLNYQLNIVSLACGGIVPAPEGSGALSRTPEHSGILILPITTAPDKTDHKFCASLYSAVSRGKPGRMERRRQIPLVQQLTRVQPGAGGCQIAVFNLSLPKVTMLCPPLPAMLPPNPALQHNVGFLHQFSGARTPTLGALLCRCVGACRTSCYL